jgi:hypothetical protein
LLGSSRSQLDDCGERDGIGSYSASPDVEHPAESLDYEVEPW